VVSFYSRDIDRFKTFYETAKRNDRRLVIPLKLAYLLHQLRSDPRLKIPDILKDKTIVLYKKRKKTGEFREGDYFPWERPFLEKAVDYNYVRRNQSSVIFNLDLTGFTELIDIHPSSGGEFIHSMSEPFSEEDLSPKVLPNWLEHFGLRYRQIHASGHCPSKELAHVIDKIHPKQLVPIHTEYPALFKAKFKKYPVRLVNRGEEIRLS
jgi:ribonuclease J